jgi:hypothetical protein
LQQIQLILVRDLKGTRAYDRLKQAFDGGQPPPKLVVNIGGHSSNIPEVTEWGETFDGTEVYVERVIAYWSQTFKGAEQQYSTTEREALAAKEGLVRFQPFIKGKKITLVTDHSALQWARTYESSNCCLAAWGAVFSAYTPDLEIVHQAGHIHSNIDPLLRLPRQPPSSISPKTDEEILIITDSDLIEAQERQLNDKGACSLGHRRLFRTGDWLG